MKLTKLHYCTWQFNFFFSVCGPPQVTIITDGTIDVTETSYTNGASLIYMCNNFYDTTDDTVTICEAENSFTWSLDSNPPTCLRSKQKKSGIFRIIVQSYQNS